MKGGTDVIRGLAIGLGFWIFVFLLLIASGNVVSGEFIFNDMFDTLSDIFFGEGLVIFIGWSTLLCSLVMGLVSISIYRVFAKE